jgi:serine/threonine protein kinase
MRSGRAPHGASPEFDGRYTGVEWLDERELACTFRAVDPRTSQRVFVKLLREEKKDDPIAARLFLNEPTILQWLVREAPETSVLPVLETGTWQQRPFFTQQLLAGWPLEAALQEHPILNSASAVMVVEGCLQFLELLHGAGVVHGDISPDNIFIETNAGIPENGRLPETLSIRLVDFNSAWRFEAHQARPERLLLKPPYTALELAMGQAMSPSTDLYALGIVFFELLTGRRPYNWRSLEDVRNLRHTELPSIPLELDVPILIQDFVGAILVTDPAKRPHSASECLRRLRALKHLHQWLCQENAADVALIPMVKSQQRAPSTGRTETFIHVLPAEGEHPAVRRDTSITSACAATAIVSAEPDESSNDIMSAACDVPVPQHEQGFHLINFSVFAPKIIAPASSFVLEVWAFLGSQRDEMLSRASRHDRLIERGSRGPVYVPNGTELTLVLRLDGFGLRDSQDSFYWGGELVNVAFIVDAPRELPPATYPGQISILHCGMLLARLVFEVEVGKTPKKGTLVSLQRQEIKKAFASYASRDRGEVLRRVQGIAATGIDVFLDVISIRAGDNWEHELLCNIRERDIFYLFWSVAASQSQWVEREWRLALSERGLDYIHPIPLVDPAVAPPPKELAGYHFNDLLLACMRSQDISLSNLKPT